MTCCITHQLKVCVNRFLELLECRINILSRLEPIFELLTNQKLVFVLFYGPIKAESDLSSVLFSRKCDFRIEKSLPNSLVKGF